MIAYILNLFDLFCTIYALSIGVEELNPLIQNVNIMIIYKIFIVGVLCIWLSKRKEQIAKYGLKIITICYGAIGVWHIIGILSLKIWI